MAKRKRQVHEFVTIGPRVAKAIIDTLKRYGAQRFDNSTTEQHALDAIALMEVPVAAWTDDDDDDT